MADLPASQREELLDRFEKIENGTEDTEDFDEAIADADRVCASLMELADGTQERSATK